ncbi:uncharacterized protein MONOS_7648 [Monocercomonoides exilis]|uniref:uncharacterized protein n=1 Tax=Monocercomonoides exilis TaxID=2049356 RepID=UPI003559C5DD|nr:hypothetical protein MONOS_7648 [Monocercomonoides exilis]|eukprot:MONOS_7648.1-p1 / transcript=MONOS_7648.1 / gene=MONOS_7648 / organism=Monocercomonoides_exilis_PA203 / gene_product=unspecified product / transcript_product=unspecified product / location=Mono_scaffold00267:13178-14887(+) / protein_length=570 / sequence_SO=supercontig / SO=protein_coding / is_pseudo=false
MNTLWFAFICAAGLNVLEVQAGAVEMTTLGASGRENGIGCLAKAANSSVRIVHAKLVGLQEGSIGAFVAGSEAVLEGCVVEATNTEKSPFLLDGSSLIANGIELGMPRDRAVACFCECRGMQETVMLRNTMFGEFVCVGSGSFLPVQGKSVSAEGCEFRNVTKQTGFVGLLHAPGCLETHLSGSSFLDCQNVFYGGVMGGMNVHGFASSNCSFCRCAHNLQFRLGANGLLGQAVGVSHEGKTFSSTQIVGNGVSTFTDCTFSSCKGIGGGGLVIGSATAEVISCTFETCLAVVGGGALLSSEHGSVVVLKSSNFIGCTATGGELLGIGPGMTQGGAILISDGKCKMTDVSGEGCIAGAGGFMAAELSFETIWEGLTIKKCRTTTGSGTDCGGAFFFSEIESLTIKEAVIERCEAGFSGGAMTFLFVDNASLLHILDSKFKENKAKGNGEKFFKTLNYPSKERFEITKEMYASDIFIATNKTKGEFTKDNFEGTTSSSRKPRTYSRSQGNFDDMMKSALSTGGIVGLVIGLVAAAIIIVVVVIVVVYVVKKRKRMNADRSNELLLIGATR